MTALLRELLAGVALLLFLLRPGPGLEALRSARERR